MQGHKNEVYSKNRKIKKICAKAQAESITTKKMEVYKKFIYKFETSTLVSILNMSSFLLHLMWSFRWDCGWSQRSAPVWQQCRQMTVERILWWIVCQLTHLVHMGVVRTQRMMVAYHQFYRNLSDYYKCFIWWYLTVCPYDLHNCS